MEIEQVINEIVSVKLSQAVDGERKERLIILEATALKSTPGGNAIRIAYEWVVRWKLGGDDPLLQRVDPLPQMFWATKAEREQRDELLWVRSTTTIVLPAEERFIFAPAFILQSRGSETTPAVEFFSVFVGRRAGDGHEFLPFARVMLRPTPVLSVEERPTWVATRRLYQDKVVGEYE